ncbi:sulfotransferase [Rivularia sp. UHCC 0363]|uniref:sulfotransferase family protein n=1 Tax=Rivularia sp. UHCC 0363 TaxID=3110244 RepID=UPI002B1F5E4D|nr:sulfotransferase [Rivularia sp. UHCC 0363]MEA5598360.1 sulfotransferase [Rivularia sp. UHCC 0363]
MKGENLIFLISQPRAGSTLLQRILENHLEIHTTAEPWLMLHPMYALRSNSYEAEYNHNLAQVALNDFLQILPKGEEIYVEGMRRMYSYLYESALADSGKRYFLDKTPRYYHIIPELYQTFPKAKFIILLRNPLAVLCSIISTWVKRDWYKLSYHEHDLITAPQLLVDGIEVIGEENCLVIQYEELLKSPESTVKTICKKLDIEFIPGMLNYGIKNTHQYGLGYKDQKKDVYLTGKPNNQNLDKWIDNLKNPQTWQVVNDYLEILSPEIVKKMGYSYEELRQVLDLQRPNALSLWRTLPLTSLTSRSEVRRHWKYHLLQIEKSLKERGFSNTLIYIFQYLIELNPKLNKTILIKKSM